ncbi:MAG: hypothetical protein KKB21_03230 [Nanoarchaeota archaeon]|nr:hypothetical protein [Nanoarchaeota archaeon]MBU4086563.1 hypothetical protein [Nanoarchaeota archaeon]
MEKETILRELKTRFGNERKELGFKSTFEQIDEIFFVEDFILKEGFVSNHLMRQISGRIIETFHGWAGYLHNFVLPNPGNAVSVTENKLFSESEKKEIWNVFKGCMDFSSKNSIIGLTKSKEEQTKFIDDSVGFWETLLKPKLTEIMNKVNSEWGK